MNRCLDMDGTLSIEAVTTARGEAVRTAFKPAGSMYIAFSNWISVEALSGNVRAKIEGLRPDSPESTMFGFTEFDNCVVDVVRAPEEELNTFGIGVK